MARSPRKGNYDIYLFIFGNLTVCPMPLTSMPKEVLSDENET